MIFEISVKLEIGQKFKNCLKSASGFFRDGDEAATFNESGILPVERDKLTNLVIVGSSITQISNLLCRQNIYPMKLKKIIFWLLEYLG